MFEKKRGKRFLASVMALVMLLSLAPVGALAAGNGDSQENTAVSLPANETDPKPVVTDEQNTENTNEEPTPPPRNEGIATLPANNNNTPVALPETPVIVKPAEGLIDEAFGVDENTSDSDNDIAEYWGGNGGPGGNQGKPVEQPEAVTSITAEYWVTNSKVTATGKTSMTISKDDGEVATKDGISIESLAPAEGTNVGGTAIFWQARVLPSDKHQTEGGGIDRTGDGQKIQKIRYNDSNFQYQIENNDEWTDFSTDDQLVFYYLIKTDFVAGIQINVSDWPAGKVSDEYKNTFRKVTYRVYEVDDSGKVISNWENKSNWKKGTYYYSGVQISAIQVRMNELEQYSIQKIQITGEDGTFNNRYEIDKNPAISGRGYSSDFGLDLRGVNATKEVFVNIYVKAYKYTVTYMDDGQPCEDPTSYFAGTAVDVKRPLAKDGYTFVEWQANSANANLEINDGKFTMPARNVVFTAVWDEAEKVNVTYTVTSTENPTPVSGMPSNSQVYKGSNVSAGSDPTTTSTTNGDKQGTWKFSGWKTNDNQTNVQNDVHYTGRWTFTETAKVNVTYEVTSTENPTPVSGMPSNSQVYKGSNVSAGSDPTTISTTNGDKQGTWKFSGWKTNDNQTNVQNDVHYTGRWTFTETAKVNVTYEVTSTENPTPVSGMPSNSQVYKGSNVSAGSDPTTTSTTNGDKQGTWKFSGWKTNDNQTNVQNDVHYTGRWTFTETAKVNVTYEVTSTENPTPVSGMPSNSQVYKGSNVSAGSDPTTISTTNGDKQGTWKFSGWKTNDNQTNVQNDVHYTGRWTFTETAKVNVTYEVTSTENPTPVSGMPSNSQVYKGSNVSAGSDPTTTSTTNGDKQGTWKFSGWKTNDNQTNVQNDVHYTGRWTFTETAKVNVTYEVTSTENPTPVSGMPSNSQVYKGSNVSAGSDPTTTSTTNGDKQGTWKFSGWKTNDNQTNVQNDVHYTGRWTFTETAKVNVTYEVTSTENPTPVSGMPSNSQVYKGSNVSAGSDPTTTSTTNGDKQGTWKFSGWKTNDNQTNVQNDVHYTGRWTFTETAKVNVTYEVTSTENPTPVSGMPSNSQVYKGSNVSAGSDPTTTSTTNGDKQGTWKFSGWKTNDNQTNVQGDVKYTGSWTFTEAKKYTITIQYVDDAQTPEKIKADEVITQYDGSKYDVMKKIPNRINKDYVKESINGSATGTVNGGDVTIIVVYTKDVLVDPTAPGSKPEGPGDNIPDKYQVIVKYVPDTTGRGTVGQLTEEVLTIYKDKEKKEFASKGQVTATGSTATAVGSKNYFSNWTDKDNTQVSTNAILEAWTFNAKGGETYTFTANFGYSGGGGGGGSRPTVTIPDDVPTGLNGTDHYAYIIGYGNNDVRPQNNITRAEVATIFFRLLTDETRTANMTKSNSYNDVKDGDWFCCAVSTLSKMGIIKGYEDGSFKPNDPISRAEFAAIAARFDPDGDKTPATFADVTSHWAKDEISIAANHGWIKGYEDGSFKPDQKITRAETMTLVNRVLNRLPETKDDLHKDMKTWVDNMDETAWYYLAVQEATNSHYFKNKTSTKFEQWTDLRDTRDWSELEK